MKIIEKLPHSVPIILFSYIFRWQRKEQRLLQQPRPSTSEWCHLKSFSKFVKSQYSIPWHPICLTLVVWLVGWFVGRLVGLDSGSVTLHSPIGVLVLRWCWKGSKIVVPINCINISSSNWINMKGHGTLEHKLELLPRKSIYPPRGKNFMFVF